MKIWPATDLEMEVNDECVLAMSPLPSRPSCGSMARPNILMFGDRAWQESRAGGLTDGVCRVPELMNLLNNSATFPWVFPCLYHVFQWHPDIAGKHEALWQVEISSLENSVGLTG